MVALLLSALVAATPPSVLTQRLVARGHGDLRTWRAAFREEGPVAVYTRASDDAPWAFSVVSANDLRTMLSLPNALHIVRQPPLALRLDVSGPEIHAPEVHAGTTVKHARTGKGVLVGIIDAGIDITHPAFRDSHGHSRIVGIWDQDNDGTHPIHFAYGNECMADAINAGLCDIADPAGHGTHVTGIAAGSGVVQGIAPDATIAIVRSSDFTRLIDAMQYLFAVADAQDMPLVVNLSVGGQYGGRDGATPLEQWLDANLGKGRIVVAAAGNGGNGAMHASADLTSDAKRLEVDAVPWGIKPTVHVDFWMPTATNLTLGIELWVQGQVAQRFTVEPSVTGDVVETDLTLMNSLVRFDQALETVDERRHLEIVVDGAQAAGLAGQAALVFTLAGTGHVDGWVSRSDGGGSVRFGDNPKTGWVLGDGEMSLDVPASARSVIAVGAYTSRTTWPSQNDGPQTAANITLGAIAPYSSHGPTAAPDRTGLKPDIAAPGSVIVSARAAGLASGTNAVDPVCTTMQGTSMSAPHVTGVVAMMLEANPDLTPSDVRRILYASARKDTATSDVPNTTWGAGKVDARAAVVATESEADGCAAAGTSVLGVLIVVFVATFIRRGRYSL